MATSVPLQDAFRYNHANKLIPLDKSAVVIDTVTHENLTVGNKYTLKGVLMDKATGKPVLIDGKEVKAETAFEVKTASGTAIVTFTFDSTALEGKTACGV